MYNKYEDDIISFTDKMTVKGHAQQTINTYKRALEKFLQFIAIDPRRATANDITRYLSSIKSPASRRQYHGTLSNFYEWVIGQPNKLKAVPYPKKQRNLPTIIDAEVIKSKLSTVKNLKHKTLLSLLYCSGIRRGEMIALKVLDIDFNRKTLFVRKGKGAKDRLVPLSPSILSLVKTYIDEYNPKEHLFAGTKGPYSATSIANLCKKHLNCKPHQIRHCFATHMLEGKYDMNCLSGILGHNNIGTTMMYNHVRRDRAGKLIEL